MPSKRPYQSQLRQQQAEATRARIIEAASARVTPGATELPFEKVAAAVPVSVRTVYRYFPSQRDLLAAVGAELEADAGWNPERCRADNLGAATRRVYATLGRYLDMRYGRTEEMEDALRVTRAPDLVMIERAIGPLTEGMDPEEARGAMAVFSGLVHIRSSRGCRRSGGSTASRRDAPWNGRSTHCSKTCNEGGNRP